MAVLDHGTQDAPQAAEVLCLANHQLHPLRSENHTTKLEEAIQPRRRRGGQFRHHTVLYSGTCCLAQVRTARTVPIAAVARTADADIRCGSIVRTQVSDPGR
jgi:hypothetical protein